MSAGLLALYPLLYLLWTLPVFANTSGGWSVAAIAAAYPLFGALVLAATVSVLVGWKAHRWSAWERL